MLERVRVIGRGRVGTALAARLEARDLVVSDDDPELVMLCVPDAAIADVARQVPVGPWVAHVSGATPLASLAPHTQRFSVHPLQTFTRDRGDDQFDGAWAAVTGENVESIGRAIWLADLLGLRPFQLADADRAAYHAGAAIASNYLVTLYRSAARLLESAGAPPEALVPLMRRTIDNGFQLTGPIARGDAATIEAHLDSIRRQAPDLEPMYRALAAATTK